MEQYEGSEIIFMEECNIQPTESMEAQDDMSRKGGKLCGFACHSGKICGFGCAG